MTRIACLTPPGTGAIATVALHGEQAWELVRQRSQPDLPTSPRAGGVWYRRVGDVQRDEVVIAARTPDEIEIHCHGGPMVVEWLMALFVADGAEPVRPQHLKPLDDITARIHQDALAALAQARTLRIASILNDQVAGAFAQAWLNADWPTLTRWLDVGRHLLQPWRIVIAGAPNVGKSSLMNALSGYQRCVVAPIPGTTRDLVALTMAFDGWLVELVDTAGLRDSGDELEIEGIARARQAATRADLVIWLDDATQSPCEPDGFDPERLLRVVNKIDQSPTASERLGISALTGQGLDTLMAAVVARLVPEVPPPGAAVPFNAHWCQQVLLGQENR